MRREILVVIFAFALSSYAQQQEQEAAAAPPSVPNAAAVADKIGQPIEFEDEVKAVSFSKSTNGYYLSFGAPYPKQVLSVWVGEHLYEQFPASHRLVGRTVRIQGAIEWSPTGPLLKIGSLDQFRIVETDEAVLSQIILDGKKDRHKIQAAVQQIFARDDFKTLDDLAEQLRQSREQTADGDWLLSIFFFSLHVPPNEPDEDYGLVQEKLTNWAKARPDSLVLILMNAQLHRDLAWHAVKTGSWRTINAETRKVYREEMATARKILEAHTETKIYPQYYQFMQDVAICQRWRRADFLALLNQATSSFPGFEPYYLNAAEELLPYWGGKKGEWEAFAEEQRQRFGAGGAGDALYARIGWGMEHRYTQHHLFRDSQVSWEKMASGFEYLIKHHPDSKYLKNAYANLAWRAGDRQRLRKLLAEIKDAPDMDIWVNLENVAFAEKFAATDSGR